MKFPTTAVSLPLLLASLGTALARCAPRDGALPTNIGVVLFPAYQALDVFGPLDMLNIFSLQRHLNLYLIADTLDPVTTQPQMNNFNSSFYQEILPTHTYADPPADLDMLIVPGGIGTRAPQEQLQGMIDYIADVYPSLHSLVSVCTGAGLAARAGILDGRDATTNKRAWNETAALGPATNWIAKARWVVDGNIYTSSGVSAGIDATLAWIADVYGEDTAENLSIGLEHVRVTDPSDDPFADHWGAVDIPAIVTARR